MKLILASGSEWRKRLLSLLELPFTVQESRVKEDQFDWEEASEVVATLATMKAEAVAKKMTDEGTIIIGADTMVSLDGELIGKPANRQEAKAIIGKLAGRTHEIWTGICVVEADTWERVVEVEKTEVTFRPMNEWQVEQYLKTKEWEGKAGAYQMHGVIKEYVKDIVGSYTNVIGLPMLTLVEMLEEMGVWVEVDVTERLNKILGKPN